MTTNIFKCSTALTHVEKASFQKEINVVNVHGNVTGLGAKEALATLEGWPS